MSYYSDIRNICPGRIEGNPTSGLHHRVAISVERVLDSALIQKQRESLTLPYTAPPGINPPYTFISANSSAENAAVSNLSIARLEERPSFARIKCTVTIPMNIRFRDAQNVIHTVTSEIATEEDVIMYVPQASVFPFEVKAVASCNCPTGTAQGETEFIVTACITVIIKVTANTDLLIPTYGFCPSPRAIEFEKTECRDFFDLPLYPAGKT